MSGTYNETFYGPTASQNEVNSQSTYLNPDELMSPKQKNQSTSPNLPLNETIINEEEVRIVRSKFVKIFSTHSSLSYFRNLSHQHHASNRLLKK